MVIKEFKVEALDDNWPDTLDLSETPHKLFRTWPTAAHPTAPSFD